MALSYLIDLLPEDFQHNYENDADHFSEYKDCPIVRAVRREFELLPNQEVTAGVDSVTISINLFQEITLHLKKPFTYPLYRQIKNRYKKNTGKTYHVQLSANA